MAEAQLLARCQAAVRECYAELSDLRATAEAARSHKTKCASLLAAATEAVTALEQLVAAAAADVERSRAAQQLAARVQATLGQVGAAGAGQRKPAGALGVRHRCMHGARPACSAPLMLPACAPHRARRW